MADKVKIHPEGTQLLYPDGSGYIYLQASEDLEPGQFVDRNVNGRLTKFKGLGIRLPKAVTIEQCPRDFWTFVLVQESQRVSPVQEAVHQAIVQSK